MDVEGILRFEFFRLAKSDGSVRWTSRWKPGLSGFVFGLSESASPAFGKRAVFFATETGGLRALDRESGNILWTHQLPKGEDGRLLAFGDPISDEGAVYAAGTDGAVYAFDPATGGVLWKADQRQGRDQCGPIAGSLAKAGGKLCFCHVNNSVVCLGAKDGRELWTKKGFFFHTPPVALKGLLWVASGTTVSALDPATGALRAEESFPFIEYAEGLVTDGRYLYLSYNGGVSQIEPFASDR